MNQVLDLIAGTGRIITLMIAEAIQSAAVIVICAFFAILEYNRLFHGALALGQDTTQAALIAAAFVIANVVTPIYALRQLRGQQTIEIQQNTLRGYLNAFCRRLWGMPTVESRSIYHNSTLHVAAGVITYATVLLAIFDLLAPIILKYTTQGTPWYVSILSVFSADLSTFISLVIGLMLSLGGVFFLQSAAHEIGVRILTDQPVRLADILAQRKIDYNQQVAQLRERITADHIAGKIADEARKLETKGGGEVSQAHPLSMTQVRQP